MKQARNGKGSGNARDDFRQLYAAIMRAGQYNLWPRRIARRLGTHQTAILMAVLNASQSNADDDGFLWTTPEFLFNATGLRMELQDKVIARLAERGLVTVRGTGKNRHVRVAINRVRAELELGQ